MMNTLAFIITLLASDVAARPGQALFERAQASFSQGRFDEARADYQAAYDAEPLPAFLFNIAQCYRNMGDYERAQLYFHRYTLRDPRGPNREAAERLAAEMSKLADARRNERDAKSPQDEPAAAPSSAAAVTTPTVTTPPDPAAGKRQSPALLVARDNGQPAPTSRPIYRRGWFWAGVGGVVLVGAAAAAIALSADQPQGTLPPIDTRPATSMP